MKKRIFALILSFIYCGLGHIYMGRIGKGFNLALIYSLLVASYLFSEFSFFLRGLNLLLIALMWIMGMVDSSVDYKFIKWGVPDKWRRLQPILSLIVIACAIITLLVPHILDSFLSNEHQETGTQNVVASLDDNSEAGKNNAEATSEANSEAIAESNAEESIETNTANLYN